MLITLIPREGTETRAIALVLLYHFKLITLIPREGTETYRKAFQPFATFLQLITLIPREGTETRGR